MSDYEILGGATSQRISIWLADSSSATGVGLTGLAFNTAGLSCYYWREDEGNANATAVTLATATRGTFTSSGFVEKDATNMPGTYEFGIPNAAIAAGAKWVRIMFKGATNLAQRTIVVRITAVNPDSATAFLTAINGVAPPTNWNLTSVDASGRLDVIKIAGTTQTARDIGASVLLSAGTGTGQLDFASGVVKSNLVQILATALTETAGQLAGGFKKFFNIATPAATMDHLVLVDTAGALTANNDKTGYALTAAYDAAKTAAQAGNAMTLTAAYDAAKTAAQAGDAMTLSAAYDAAKTASTQASVNLVKTQTDKLVFTVANNLDVNIHCVHDVHIIGAGTAGDSWRPG